MAPRPTRLSRDSTSKSAATWTCRCIGYLANTTSAGLRATCGAVPIRQMDDTSHGHPQRSKAPLKFIVYRLIQCRVTIIDPDNSIVIATLPADNVFELGFSPLGTYVITWQRATKDENGDAVKNLKVWRMLGDGSEASENDIVGKFVQKNQNSWNLQYTFDEKFCARTVTNEVQIYESHDLTRVWNKLRVEGVTDFAVSPGENHSIAVFVPERKGQPAAVKVYNVPQFDTPASQKSFYKGDKVELKWNDAGTTLIVLAQTEADKTGKSYYGETTLYLLSANGGFDSRLDLGIVICSAFTLKC